MKIPYIRIATSFYKVVEKPSVFGESTTILAPWNVTMGSITRKKYQGTMGKCVFQTI
jgi:hypothetical protein